MSASLRMSQPTVHQSADDSRVGREEVGRPSPHTAQSVRWTKHMPKPLMFAFDLNLDKQPPVLAVETAY